MASLRIAACALLGYALFISLAVVSASHGPPRNIWTTHRRSHSLSSRLTLRSLPPVSPPNANVKLSGSNHTLGTGTPMARSIESRQTVDQVVLDDIATMTERRLTFIVADAGNPSDVSQWLSTLGVDGKWPDSEIDYTAGCDARRANWPAQAHWQRILTMAAACHGGLSGADQYVQDPNLLDAISRAMDYWFNNDFTNPSCLDSGGTSACPCGTPGFWNTNWFSNIILIPNLVAQSCLLIGDSLTASQCASCTRITGRSYGTLGRHVNGLGFATGANLLDIARIGIDDGLLNFNASIIADAYQQVHAEVVIENDIQADGIRADGSFGQHGGVLYNGNYGKDFANDVLLLEIIAGGTQFAAGDVTKDAFATLIDADQWMIYRNILTGVLHWDFSVLGRFISFPVIDAQATGSIKINVTEIAQLGEEWDSAVLTAVASSLSTDSSSANVGDITGNRMFFANDYMVQRGSGYVTTVKMYSNRTKNTECINSQNPLGFHLSDGTVYTYLQGNEYEDIAAAWDWNLIPGITVDYGATPLSCDNIQFAGVNSFVGGVSNGNVGAAVMKFTNPLTQSLSWQKAWFFLDDNVQHVMISAISSTSDAPVFSVLDQKRQSGQVFVDGFPMEQTAKSSFTRPSSLWHDNVGYIFDTAQTSFDITVDVGPKSGNWSDIGISTQGAETVDLFAAWIDHGAGVPVSPVSYSIFPAVDKNELVVKALGLQLENVQNDEGVSAVYDARYEIAMFVFWDLSGGSVHFTLGHFGTPITVTSSGNAAVIYDVQKGNVTVSDPSQTLTTVILTFTADSEDRVPPNWTFGLSKQLLFELPQGGLAGSSVTQTL